MSTIREVKGALILVAWQSLLFRNLNLQLRTTSREDDFNQVSNSLVVTSTCLTGLNWPKDILNQFDVVCIDEAAFAPDWLTLPLILSDIPRSILSGDHHQLPPVMVSNHSNYKCHFISIRIILVFK